MGHCGAGVRMPRVKNPALLSRASWLLLVDTYFPEPLIMLTNHASQFIRGIQSRHFVTLSKGGIVEYRVETIVQAAMRASTAWPI